MAYEIFSRGVRRLPTPAVTLNRYGRMQFNKGASARMEKEAIEYVLILWDKDKRKVALRPITKKDVRAYRISFGEKGNGVGISTKTFFDHIRLNYQESRTVPVELGDGDILLEFEIPEDMFFTDAQPQLLRPRSTKTA